MKRLASIRLPCLILQSRSDRRAILTLCSAYTLAWGGLLLSSNAIFWDDWTFIESDSASIQMTFNLLGVPQAGFIHLVLFEFGPGIYRILGFFLYLLAGICVYGILKTYRSITISQAAFASAIFLSIPLNAARHTLITLPYAISLAAFYVAWYLLVSNNSPTKSSLVKSCTLLIISYSTGSFLAFSALPFLHFFVIQKKCHQMVGLAFVKKYWYLLSLPITFFIFDLKFLEPSGIYAGYNSLNLYALLTGGILLALALLVAFAAYRIEHLRPSQLSSTYLIFSIGIFALLLAIFPYLSVGRQGFPAEWGSRDTLLWPLGISMIFLSAIRYIATFAGGKVAIVLASVVITFCIFISSSITYSYWIDWRKQQMIISYLVSDLNVKKSSLVIFKDETTEINMFASPFRFYAWNGILKRAYGTSDRFGINSTQLSQYEAGDFDQFYGLESVDYGAKNYVPTQIASEVRISSPRKATNQIKYFEGLYLKLRFVFGLPPMPHQISDLDNLQIQTKPISIPQDSNRYKHE